jgi:hypothetical protein
MLVLRRWRGRLSGQAFPSGNNLLQIAIEPIGRGPIYTCMAAFRAAAENSMQGETILKFLADSSYYLTR